MKKLKFLPSVLMLVLCVGVLCMGIYAASPNSNQITGSITINAANPEVTYRAYLGNSFKESTLIGEVSGRQNTKLTLDSENLVLDLSSAANVEQVKPIEIWLEVTNKSTTESLGAYFAEGAVNRTAVYNDILMTQPIYEDPEAQEKNTVANINLPFYHQLPKAMVEGGETTYYPVYMRLTITPATMVESRLENLEFTLNLNIESYVASENTNDELYKVPEGTFHDWELSSSLQAGDGLDFKGCKGVVFSSYSYPEEGYIFGEGTGAIEGMDITYISLAPNYNPMQTVDLELCERTLCNQLVLTCDDWAILRRETTRSYTLIMSDLAHDMFDGDYMSFPRDGITFGLYSPTGDMSFEDGVVTVTGSDCNLWHPIFEFVDSYINIDGVEIKNQALIIKRVNSIPNDEHALYGLARYVEFDKSFDFSTIDGDFVNALKSCFESYEGEYLNGLEYVSNGVNPYYCLINVTDSESKTWSISSDVEYVLCSFDTCPDNVVIPSSVKYVYGNGFQYAYLLQTITFEAGEDLLAPFVFPTQICPEERMPVNVKWYTDSNKTVSAGDSITARPGQTYYFKAV